VHIRRDRVAQLHEIRSSYFQRIRFPHRSSPFRIRTILT
jgi:hypothetical protein